MLRIAFLSTPLNVDVPSRLVLTLNGDCFNMETGRLVYQRFGYQTWSTVKENSTSFIVSVLPKGILHNTLEKAFQTILKEDSREIHFHLFGKTYVVNSLESDKVYQEIDQKARKRVLAFIGKTGKWFFNDKQQSPLDEEFDYEILKMIRLVRATLSKKVDSPNLWFNLRGENDEVFQMVSSDMVLSANRKTGTRRIKFVYENEKWFSISKDGRHKQPTKRRNAKALNAFRLQLWLK